MGYTAPVAVVSGACRRRHVVSERDLQPKRACLPGCSRRDSSVTRPLICPFLQLMYVQYMSVYEPQLIFPTTGFIGTIKTMECQGSNICVSARVYMYQWNVVGGAFSQRNASQFVVISEM